jgi:hypothetical protein
MLLLEDKLIEDPYDVVAFEWVELLVVKLLKTANLLSNFHIADVLVRVLSKL